MLMQIDPSMYRIVVKQAQSWSLGARPTWENAQVNAYCCAD
ncbi:hypothetical protein ACXX9E_29385 [Pseudomonas sp. GNP014]